MPAGQIEHWTGKSSGLGRFLSESLTEDKELIIHCGWDTKMSDSPSVYTKKAIDTAHNILSLPCNKIVFISTVDVYPPTHSGNEDDKIDAREIVGIYGLTKFIVEDIFLSSNKEVLVIRPSSLLGKYSRGLPLQIKSGKTQNINEKSSVNFTLYEDILEVIRSGVVGIWNLVSVDNTTPYILGCRESPGSYLYNVGRPSATKLTKHFPHLTKTSRETYQKWLNEF